MNDWNDYTRLPTNTNLTLYYDSHFQGFPLMPGKGPFLMEYLDQSLVTIRRALSQYPRLLAIRFDLRFPQGMDPCDSSVIQRFVESLKAKIKHNREQAELNNQRCHNTRLRYIWVREYGQNNRPHYHFALLLNRDAYHVLGYMESDKPNMYNRIVEAWSSALGFDEPVLGLVHFPENAVYSLDAKDGEQTIADLFERVSYLCKADTKSYGDHSHQFGCSRL